VDLKHIRAAITRIKKEMLDAARELEFEKAAELRDRMLDLQSLELKYL
jgi:excinuclease ABC subunit B